MKERPIIFSTPLVQAILQGRKTMTRRVVKPQPTSIIDARKSPNVAFALSAEFEVNGSRTIICPYGQIGDRLWVRETFMDGPNYHNGMEKYVYKASASNQFIEEWPKCWTPSIHMPRTASRILLEITNVRVERVQDITEDDAIREGAEMALFEAVNPDFSTNSYKNGFMKIWTSIYGNESWNTNPWVWVVEFKKI